MADCQDPQLHEVEEVRESERNLVLRSAALVALVTLALGIWWMLGTWPPGLGALVSVVAWFGGAAALGLLTGFITGASEKQGTASDLLGFVSGGVIIPLLGAFATILQQTKTTTETYTYGVEHLTEKVVEVATRTEPPFMSPLVAAGGFFFFYSLCAVWGIGLGVRRRNAGSSTSSGGIKKSR